VPVSVSLNADALTTLARVYLDLEGLTSDGDKRDSVLNAYINAASTWLARTCSRTFHRQGGGSGAAAAAIVEKIAGMGTARLRVARPPIIGNPTSVKIDGSAITIDDDYTVDDAELGWLYRGLGWPWSAKNAGGLDQGPLRGSESKNIEVTYNGGFITRAQADVGGVFAGQTITLPDDLEDACIELVVSRWKRRGEDVRVQSRSYEGSGLTFFGAPVSPAVAAVVANYALIPHA
jgi:hypothetical protein